MRDCWLAPRFDRDLIKGHNLVILFGYLFFLIRGSNIWRGRGRVPNRFWYEGVLLWRRLSPPSVPSYIQQRRPDTPHAGVVSIPRRLKVASVDPRCRDPHPAIPESSAPVVRPPHAPLS